MLKLPRRDFLRLASGAAALPFAPQVARAQDYPSRPIRLFVGFPPGGSADIIARLIGQWLQEQLGQPFIVENRAGAGTNLATEVVARAAPDGYTLLLVTGTNTSNVTLYDKLSFNFVRDIAPVAGLIDIPLAMLVSPSVQAKTVPEFIALAKANPRKVNMASTGIGSITHLAGELFKMMAGVDMVHVPYRASALTDLLSGQVQVHFGTLPGSIEHIRAGNLRVLAVTTKSRSDALPDVPTVGDYVPGYEASGWQGVGAPKNTPAEIVERLNTGINAGLADPKIKARLAGLGSVPMPMTAAKFGKFVADETEKWAKVIKFADIKPE
jgi:tripartite-type tricarboxylate transporter receptor subunit TctC